ncbi:hypothetical protein E2C01_097622 [Portunus trituberculatus]|uniref:Uncharacterized protein n=1 Tax=Portunus trituberculatus TaxID=210409 RepID=A0A5B7K665_PORTR|nr:hypothetical protein [Portunus trituberculatus]
MTRIVSSSAVKQQIAMTLLMAPSQRSHFLEKQASNMLSFYHSPEIYKGLGEEIPRILIFRVSARALAAI